MDYIVLELTKYNIYNFLTVYSLMILVAVNFVVALRKKEVVYLSILTSLLGMISFFFQIYYCGILIDNGIDVKNKLYLVILFVLISVVTLIADVFLLIKNKKS